METETLKLEVCLICLKSNYLERRIQGIRELNQIIRNNRMISSKSFTNAQLIQWLKDNEVFSILFDQKKTHLQIVQRTGEVLKLLLAEEQLDQNLLDQFWQLSKIEYKFEIYKILNEISYYLQQSQIDYLFVQIKQMPPEKVGIEEFSCLSDLGRMSRTDEFKQSVSDFFWEIICNSDDYKDEIVTNCITRFCEMVKYWELNKKEGFFISLMNNLKEFRSSIPSLRLFKQLIKDQFDRLSYQNKSSGMGMYPNNQQDQSQGEQIGSTEPTIQDLVNNLIKQGDLSQIILNNLGQYFNNINSKEINQSIERTKLFILNQRYSHHEEIDERLQFLTYICKFHSYQFNLASISEFQISKQHLEYIYQFLVRSKKVLSDKDQFLNWCKTSCEQSSFSTTILDLNEVGEFFSEKMKNKELDVENLTLVDFEFLQQYFLSKNEQNQKLMKSSKSKVQKPKKQQNMNFFMQNQNNNQKKEEEEDKDPVFKLIQPPNQLEQLDIVWNIALQCTSEKVIPKAINFLIKIYSALDEDLNDQRATIQDELIAKCMDILRNNKSEFTVRRTIEIIKNIIYEAERKGTGDVQPHNAVLKGELFDKIFIKNRASSTKGMNLCFQAFSNCTIWEFRREVASQLDLAPKYLKLERLNNQVIEDKDNGKTLAQMNIQNKEIIFAYKVDIEEEVAHAPLVGQDGQIVEKAKEIFHSWFDMYSNENDKMTKETCALFVRGCTGETPLINDDRIQNLFNAYDYNNDGFIEREDFMKFYETSCKVKPDTVRENLKAHNIRPDLKKLSEIQEISQFSMEDMPRYKISKNQEYFDLLIEILKMPDRSAEDSWSLIQMLATNQGMYQRVLQLKTDENGQNQDGQKINWDQFFDSGNVYKLLYTLEIIESIMEEDQHFAERVQYVKEEQKAVLNKMVPKAPPLPGMPDLQSQEEESKNSTKQEAKELTQEEKDKAQKLQLQNQIKIDWIQQFLKQEGFSYILSTFMKKQIHQSDENLEMTFNKIFELKHVAFLLKLLNIFIMAAFSTSSEQSVYQTAQLIRRQSSSQPTEDTNNEQEEQSTFKALQTLMEGGLGQEIIKTIDYKQLQLKILDVISQILQKNQLIFEDKLIIENALSLWISCILHLNDLINDFYAFKNNNAQSKIQSCDDLILNGLLFCSYDKVRDEFKQTLIYLSQKLQKIEKDPLTYLLKLLSDNFKLIMQYECKQYFDLFCQLIDQHFMLKNLKQQINNEGDQAFDPEQLLSTIIDNIKHYNNLVKNQTDVDEALDEEQQKVKNQETENIYCGLMQITGKIIENFDIQFTEKILQQKQIINEIFVNFLFASVYNENQETCQVIKIKNSQKGQKSGKKLQFGSTSKEHAYKLLNSLIRKSPKLMDNFLKEQMIPLVKIIRRIDGWNYTPPGVNERTQQYVGLKNLGCICYMNSMQQQFFMIPTLRYNLLTVDDLVPETIAEYRGLQVDDNMLHQLQKLIAHLELSERLEYNPIEFCFSFKEFDGNPTNISEQKDAQEYLGVAFDRLENHLKDTSRKYLLQSIFGGKTINQIVCQECGKQINREETFYNLSLTVKDIKTMKDSLNKMIEGETINEYTCEGCQKKVDISKRTLISQTPNVLIVHLQRLLFNFETFRNDKINSYFEFPYYLDLKPYSFYDVMEKENRLPKKKDDDDDIQEEQKEQDADSKMPEPEDCFEYKLVGVTVHSGSANAGHYWSYINTQRGFQEPNEDDPNWEKTENDTWMEFNDSIVRPFKFEKLKDECFGGDKSSDYDSGWSFGSSYGKSAYMLFYERRKKKPIKILIDEQEYQEEKKKEAQVFEDEEKKEFYKLIDYKNGVEDLKPNQIYKQVFEDNKKFEFENDIYSTEFFEFVKGILDSALQFDEKTKHEDKISILHNTLIIGKKAIFDILAKCFHNQGIKEMGQVLIKILGSEKGLCKKFMELCYEEDQFKYLYILLLECSDSTARTTVAEIVKFILNTLKFEDEKDYLYEITTVTQKNEQGVEVEQQIPKSLCTRFFAKAIKEFNELIAKNWSRFEQFFDVMYCVAVGIQEERYLNENNVFVDAVIDKEKERFGLNYFHKLGIVEKGCDFLLGKKSPLCQLSEKRYEMGGTFTTPNYSSLIKLITKIIQDEELLQEQPLTEVSKKMILQNDLLKVMLGSSSGSKHFGRCLAQMCKDNEKLSRQVSKVFIKSINNSNYETVKNYLTALKPFLKMNDSLKHMKLEWVLGWSQVQCKKGFRDERFKYGLELVDKINDETAYYKNPIKGQSVEEALLTQLIKCKGRLDTFAINCLKELLSLMSKDDDIARYVFKQQPISYQYVRYSDWMGPYLSQQRDEIEKGNSYSYFKSKHDTILEAQKLLEIYDKKCEVFKQEQKQLFQKIQDEGGFKNIEQDWLKDNDEVIPHDIPQLIVSKQVGDEIEHTVFNDHPLVKVQVFEMTNQYNYSNPTGLFNLSLPHIEIRTGNYQSISYMEHKSNQFQQQRQQNEQNNQQDGQPQNNQTQFNMDNVKTVNWFERQKEGNILLKVVATSKAQSKIKFRIRLIQGEGFQNMDIPVSYFKDSLIESESKCICHLIKIDPTLPFSKFTVSIEADEKHYQSQLAIYSQAQIIGTNTSASGGTNYVNDSQISNVNIAGNQYDPQETHEYY